MKQKAGPAVIIVAVVVIAGFMYGMYKVAFQPQSPEPSPANAPAYARQGAGTPGMSTPAPPPVGSTGSGASGSAPSSPPGKPDYANTYRQGGQFQRRGAGMPAGNGQ